MKQLKERLIAVFLALLMVFISMSDMLSSSAYAAPPSYPPIAQVTDPDLTLSVTYDDVAVAGRGNSYFYVGETVPYYVNIAVSSSSRNIPGAYSKIYLPKAIFGGGILPSNVSSWENRPATNYLSIDNTSNSDYTIITMKYNMLSGGITQSVPFRATIQSNTLAEGESYTVSSQVYDAGDNLLASTNSTFVAHTFPVGIYSNPLDSGTFKLLLGSSELQNPTTLANDYKSKINIHFRRTNWPATSTYLGTTGVLSENGWTVGADRRKTRITVKLPTNANFDPTDSENAGWTYNAATRTITKDKLFGNSYWTIPEFGETFVVTYNNQPVGTDWSTPVRVDFPTSWQYINDDGTLDTASLEKSVNVAKYASYPGHAPVEQIPNIGKTALNWGTALGAREDTLHTYRLHIHCARDNGDPVQYPILGVYKHTISSIVDTPRPGDEVEFVSYAISYSNQTGRVRGALGPSSYIDVPVWSPTQVAAMQNNKLIGTKPDGTTEVIATNVSIGTASPEVTLPTPKVYKKIELKFDNPIEIQAPASWIFVINYKFRLAESTYNRIRPLVAALTSPTDYSVYTKNVASIYGDGQTTPLNVTNNTDGSDCTRWTKAVVAEDAHYIQGQNFGTTYVDNTITLDDHISFGYNLGGSHRNIKKPKFLFLVDPGLELVGTTTNSSWTPEFTPTDLNNYRVEYNYKGTGKTAYIWDQLPDLQFPHATAANYGGHHREIYFNPTFKFKSNVKPGAGTIDSYMYWDNNEEDIGNEVVGKYPDTMDLDNDGNITEKFSHKQATYFYSPPLELILTKKSKRADVPDTQYSAVTTADSEQIVDYQLNIFNNSNGGTSGLTFFDILPHVGDKSIMPDSLGNYTARGSTYKVTLTGPITPLPNYTFYYSTSPVTEGNIAANYTGATWATSVADYSQVTMIKAVMNPGYTLGRGATDIISFKAKMPNTTALTASDKAVNTFAGFAGDNYSGGIEALNNIVIPKKYKISGKVYYDVPPTGLLNGNGKNLPGDPDIPAPGKTVEIFYSDGTPVLDAANNPRTTTTDANGDYSFENLIKTDTYKIVVKPGPTIKISTISVPSTATLIGNDFIDTTPSGGDPAFSANVSVTPSADTKTANAALFADNSGLVIKYIDMAGNPIPLDSGSGSVADTVDHSYRFKAPYNITPPTSPSGASNFTYDSVDLSNGGHPLSGNLEPGEITVKLKYKRKNAGDITVHHYELGHTDELYTPTGLSTPAAENLSGVEKQGLTADITNRSADILDLDFDHVDVSGAISPTTPGSAGETTLTYNSAPQTVIYYYKRKDAGNITVHHYEVGQSTELYKPGASPIVAPEIFDGTGKRGLPKNLTNKEANIANYEYVSVDTSAAPGTVSTAAAGATTVKYRATPQSVIYRYQRKSAGNVTVNYLEQGTNAVIDTQEVLDGTAKLGLTFTTVQKNVTNFDFVSSSGPTSGTYTTTPQTVNYYYRRKDAGNVTVNYLEYGTNAVLASQEILNGAQKLGLAFSTVQKNVANYSFVSVTPAASGTYTVTPQTINYYYVRGNAGSVLVHHYEAGGTTSLAPDELLLGAGKLGLPYSTTPATITNFSVVNATPPNYNGVYQAGGLTVVTYEYARDNAGDVTVHHFERGTTNSLVPDITLSGAGKLGLPYMTNELPIQNFTLVAQPTNKDGIFASGHQIVTYFYRRADAGDVLVHHYEVGTDTSLLPDEHLSGAERSGLSYSTSAGTVSNYSVIDAHPTDYAGVYPASKTTVVTYYYKRDDAGDVTVRHVEAGSNVPLLPDEILSGVSKSGLPYNTSHADIENYTVVNPNPANRTGIFAPGVNYVITYEYRRDDAGDVTANYKDIHGNRVENTEVLSGVSMLGLPYNTVLKDILYYDLVVNPLNASGVFTKSDITVDYIYKRQDAGNVIIKYLDEDRNTELDNTIVLDGSEKIGMPYTSEAKTFEYLDLVSMPDNANGVFNMGTQRVNYLYRRKDAKDVIAHYINPAGLPLDEDDVLDGRRSLGLPYATNAKDIEGYHLIRVEGAPNGTFTDKQIDINYVYLKNPSEIIIPGPVKVATPSQIINPKDWNQDYIIRPHATPSIATSSNGGRGGSGGNSSIRPAKAIADKKNEVKENLQKPQNADPQIPSSIDNTKADGVDVKFAKEILLPVPRTFDSRNIFVYWILLIVSCAAIILLRKKDK